LTPTGGSWIPGVGQKDIAAARKYKRQRLVANRLPSTNEQAASICRTPARYLLTSTGGSWILGVRQKLIAAAQKCKQQRLIAN